MSHIQRCMLLSAIIAVVEFSAASRVAAVPTGYKWPQPGPCGSNCPGAPVTITYSYQNNLFDGGLLMPDNQPLPIDLIRGSIEEAFGLWASVAPLHFVEVPDDGLSYGQIRFQHDYIDGPDPPPPAGPMPKAHVTSIACPGHTCYVEFDDGDRWQEVGTQPQPDILGAAIHEIGHTLGLAHTNVVGANMYWIFHRFSGLGSGELFPDDIAGIHAIYGAGVGSVTPLVPEPSTFALAFLAAGWWFTRRRAR